MWRSRWRCVIKPAYSVSFLLSLNIFVWQNVLYFPNDLRIMCDAGSIVNRVLRNLHASVWPNPKSQSNTFHTATRAKGLECISLILMCWNLSSSFMCFLSVFFIFLIFSAFFVSAFFTVAVPCYKGILNPKIWLHHIFCSVGPLYETVFCSSCGPSC